jgi:ribokinase
MPSLDGISYAGQFTSVPGGSGGNVAEGLARLGHSVRFLGVVGDDEGGRMLLHAFESAGVDTGSIRVEKGQRSAACFIAVDRHGQRLIISLGGVALFDRVADITVSQLAGAKILFIADAFLNVAQAAISCLEAGSRVVFNPGGLMTASGLEGLQEVLERTEVLIVSQVESERLTGNPDPEEAGRILTGSGPKAVLLTLGKNGALVADGKSTLRVPALSVEQVVDTTGAGDAFSAGVIAGLLEGATLEKAARLGCAVAARKIRYFGSRNGLPDRAQINAWL